MIGKILRPAQCQHVGEFTLEVAVRAFDSTILMGNATVVAGWIHSVMSAK